MAQLVSQYDGKDRWYLRPSASPRAGAGCLLPAEGRCLGEIEATFSRLVWELRPKTALGDLIAC
jgi:hypothetical protein